MKTIKNKNMYTWIKTRIKIYVIKKRFIQLSWARLGKSGPTKIIPKIALTIVGIATDFAYEPQACLSDLDSKTARDKFGVTSEGQNSDWAQRLRLVTLFYCIRRGTFLRVNPALDQYRNFVWNRTLLEPYEFRVAYSNIESDKILIK